MEFKEDGDDKLEESDRGRSGEDGGRMEESSHEKDNCEMERV